MKIAVIFGSHRFGGINGEIELMLKNAATPHSFDFIHMADHNVMGCLSCHLCSKEGHCVLPKSENDYFEEIFDKLKSSDSIFIITPVYAVIPSRLTALFERLTSVLFDSNVMNTDKNPLLNKKTAIFSYCSSKICDETQLKVIFQKFLMKNYSFTDVNYNYINNGYDISSYESIIDYVKDVVTTL